jgi:hypothetical protein
VIKLNEDDGKQIEVYSSRDWNNSPATSGARELITPNTQKHC